LTERRFGAFFVLGMAPESFGESVYIERFVRRTRLLPGCLPLASGEASPPSRPFIPSKEPHDRPFRISHYGQVAGPAS
jgi:hypothetical protein